MVNRSGGVVLSPEDSARYNDDERANLRSWGIGVPEPATFSPDEEVPIDEPLIYRNPIPRNFPISPSTQTAYALNYTQMQKQYYSALQGTGSASAPYYDPILAVAKGLR